MTRTISKLYESEKYDFFAPFISVILIANILMIPLYSHLSVLPLGYNTGILFNLLNDYYK